MSVSIIITSRNESMLQWTVDNIRRTSSPDEIVIVYDGLQRTAPIDGVNVVRPGWTTAQGVAKCRHRGAMYAKSEYLVFIDAHMDFEDGWLDKLLDTAKDHPKGVIGAKSAKITAGGMKTTTKTLSGAYIRYIGADGHPLEVEWGDPVEPGPVQCCLGATYCIRRDRYEEIGVPWARGFGWGTSEQTLCMINEFCGGENILADVTTGHIYRENSEIPYDFGHDHKIGRQFNRLRLIKLLPIPEDEKRRLMQIAMDYRPLRPYSNAAISILELTDDSDITNRFSLTWEQYKDRWWPAKEDKQRKPPKHIQPKTEQYRDERFI